LPLPTVFLGYLVSGPPAHALNIAYGGVSLWLGIALLRLTPRARAIAIGFFAFSVVNGALFVVLPGFIQRISTSLTILPIDWRPLLNSE